MSKEQVIQELRGTVEALSASLETNIPTVAAEIATAITNSLREEGKVLFAGNGGSAADAQHMAAEFVNYFAFPRSPLAAIALTTDTSILTSISNDSDYEFVFSRQVDALAKQGDILWIYTTSGNSKNIIQAAKTAKAKSVLVAAFVGENVGNIEQYADFLISVPSNRTPKIQEVHLALGHAISGIVEENFFGNSNK